jgi:hypothetical protein
MEKRKSYIKPDAVEVLLNLNQNVLDSIGVGTGSKGADPEDSFSKKGMFDADAEGGFSSSQSGETNFRQDNDQNNHIWEAR